MGQHCGREQGCKGHRRSLRDAAKCAMGIVNARQSSGERALMDGVWIPVSEYAGGYTAKFAKEVVLGAEECLAGPRRREVFAEGGEFAEEDLMEEEEGTQGLEDEKGRRR